MKNRSGLRLLRGPRGRGPGVPGERLEGRVDDRTVSRTLMHLLHEPHPEAQRRVRARTSIARRPRRRGTLLVVAGAALAGAAALTWFAVQPAPSQPLAITPLESAGDLIRTEPVPGLTLAFTGAGSVGGETDAIEIAWRKGDLTVDLEPERRIPVVVTTREAIVRVLGTRFTVHRDAFGTTVAVSRGEVEVTCTEQAPLRLDAHDKLTCGPTSPSALLGAALALQDQGAPADQVLATVDRGLDRVDGQDPAAAELLRLRIYQLRELERTDEALAGIELYLSQGHGARRDELEALAGVLRGGS